MNKEAFREVLTTNLPFAIITASGERYEIRHPDFVSVADGDGTTVVVHDHGGNGFSILDLATITDLKLSTAKAS